MRKNPIQYLGVLFFTVFLAVGRAYGGLPPSSWHLVMGNPSGATSEPSNRNNFLMEKRYFALSYNNQTGTPNWVSWHLSSDYLGEAERKNNFDADASLPRGFRKIEHKDYTGSGFDRGHMCPHSDRAADLEMSYATFVMTNIVPQSHENNAGAWESLEIYSRWLASEKDQDLFIVSGPIGKGGEGKEGYRETIANGAVTVPNKVFKVILAVNRLDESDPLAWVNARTRLIAVIMPNDRKVDQRNWGKYRVSVKAVEQATGLKFFDKVPAAVLAAAKEKVDNLPFPKLPQGHH